MTDIFDHKNLRTCVTLIRPNDISMYGAAICCATSQYEKQTYDIYTAAFFQRGLRCANQKSVHSQIQQPSISLTHWGRDKMAAVSQTTLSNAFSFLNENVRISIKISLKFVPKGPINNNPSLVQIMAWRRLGDKPLSEPMMVSLLTYICVTRPQWVNLGSDVYEWRIIWLFLTYMFKVFEHAVSSTRLCMAPFHTVLCDFRWFRYLYFGSIGTRVLIWFHQCIWGNRTSKANMHQNIQSRHRMNNPVHH